MTCYFNYYTDDFGRLWKGPVAPKETLHYATFHGYMTVPPFDPIWQLERSDPDPTWCQITVEQASRVFSMFRNEVAGS